MAHVADDGSLPSGAIGLELMDHLLTLLRFSRLCWTETTPVIDENDLGSLEMEDHVWPVVAVDVAETEGHWHQVGIWTIELWTEIDSCVGSITAGEFHDLDPIMQIEGKKMTGHAWCLIVTHVGIDLKGARTSIVQVVECSADPVAQCYHHR